MGLLLSITGLACCRAVTSFRFSFSRVFLSVKGFKKGTGAFDLTMPSGRTGFLGMVLALWRVCLIDYKVTAQPENRQCPEPLCRKLCCPS